MIEARGVTSRAGDRLLVDGVDLALRPGEFVALLGPNGAGKSSLVKALTGERPATGEVLLDGRRWVEWSAGERARRVAVLGQHSRLGFPMKARSVVELGRLPHQHVSARRNRAIAAAALERVGMSDRAEQPFPTLSGGERRLVDLARVLAQLWDAGGDGWTTRCPHPDGGFLFLDEPTAGLDLAHAVRACWLVRGFVDAGLGALAVLHDINLAVAVADRILVMKGGRLVHTGPPRSITRSLLTDVWEVPFRCVGDPPAWLPVHPREAEAVDPVLAFTRDHLAQKDAS